MAPGTPHTHTRVRARTISFALVISHQIPRCIPWRSSLEKKAVKPDKKFFQPSLHLTLILLSCSISFSVRLKSGCHPYKLYHNLGLNARGGKVVSRMTDSAANTVKTITPDLQNFFCPGLCHVYGEGESRTAGGRDS